MVSGVITDAGDTLCYSAIIGREYLVATIVNTGEAAAKIKSGQRIRMDAIEGVVFILDE